LIRSGESMARPRHVSGSESHTTPVHG